MQDYIIQNELMVVMMPKELDHHIASQLSKELDSMIDSYSIRRLTFDFSQTNFMDSSGIGTIIGRCRKLKYLNGKVMSVNMNKRVEHLFRAAGLHRLIDCGREI